jgi:GT2 family glycosyltransferase
VREFESDPDVGWVYSDTVVVDADREPVGHYFKPDWNPALLLSQNFLCHFSAIRMDLVRDAGGYRSEFDGSQDWDLALRVTERLAPTGVAHIPHVLYLWRAIPGSVAADGVDAKPYAADAGRRAVEEHVRRIGAAGYVVPVAGHQSVRLVTPRPQPRVEVVVPSTGRRALLQPCVEGVLSRTAYDELHVTVAVPEDAYTTTADRDLLQEIEGDVRGRVLPYPQRPFNFARIVNEAFAACDAPLVLLLNDDTQVLDPDWLDYMVGYALLERVGAVGSLLLYEDGTIQSAGMLVGARGAAEHLYHHRGPHVFGYSDRARVPQDLTVVAGSCMLVRREAFEDVGGWDERLPAAYNDVDFCLRLHARGWRVVYVPDAAIVHHESATFGQHQQGREGEHHADLARLSERWGDVLHSDPMHNPNLELDASHPERLAFPPRSSYSWRLPRGEAAAQRPRSAIAGLS